MHWRNSPTHYGLTSIVLHWLVAVAVFGLFALGFWMVGLNYYSSWYRTAPDLHKSIGILLLLVMLLRVLWRFVSPALSAWLGMEVISAGTSNNPNTLIARPSAVEIR